MSSDKPTTKQDQAARRKLGIWILVVCLAITALAAIMAFAVNKIYNDAIEQAPAKQNP